MGGRLRRMKELLLNTPQGYWLIIRGYHIHKSFWGLLVFLLGLIILFFSKIFGIMCMIIGGTIVILSVCGHIHTNNKPYFKLWDKHGKTEDGRKNEE